MGTKGERRLSSPLSDTKVEGRRKLRSEAPFVHECRNLPGSSDLSMSCNKLYWDLIVGSASDPLVGQFGWSMEEAHSHWN